MFSDDAPNLSLPNLTTLVSSGLAMAFPMAVDETTDPHWGHLLDFSCNYSFDSEKTTTTTSTTTHSTTTTTSDDGDGDGYCNYWNDTWSPVVDWDALPNGGDEFQDLIESMMAEYVEDEGSNSAVSASTMTDDCMMIGDEETAGGEDCKGLRLVHLLMAAAEALFGSSKNRDLARVILVRLKELVSPTEGTNMERLAAYFTEGLQVLLDGTGSSGHGSSKHIPSNSAFHHDGHNQTDILAAFQLLQDMTPVFKFGHFTANQAILEAVSHDRRIHIVDYDIMEGIQWPSLMQALVSRKEGPPAPHLRITALSRGGGSSRRSFGTVQETGRRLVAFAASIGQPFSFHQCRLESDETFRPSALKLVRGEALVFNCMLHLPHSMNYRAPDSVASFLSGSKSLNPRLWTLVEEEVGPIGDTGCLGRFMDSLHHYSAVYDSLEAGFPLQSRARALVERVFLGPRISGSVTRMYRSMIEKERGGWGEVLSENGFKAKSISFANHCQAKLLLGLFNDGYSVEELGHNRLVLKWKTRRLLSASLWYSSSEISQ